MLLNVKQQQLSEMRKSLNLSQHKLSVLSGLSGNAIFRMETQAHKVSVFRAKAVADILGCEVSDIFYMSNGSDTHNADCSDIS